MILSENENFVKPEIKLQLTDKEQENFAHIFKQAVKLIISADALMINTGAGMGVDAGIPTYRGKYGIYDNKITVDNKIYEIADFSTPEIFIKNPAIAWSFHGRRLIDFKNTVPHRGFYILLELIKKLNDNYFVFTSNIDNQFQKAGFDGEKILECHGSVFHFQEVGICDGPVWKAENVVLNFSEKEYKTLEPLPFCGETGRPARPNVLLFGDEDWNPKRYYEQLERFNKWKEKIINTNAKLVIIEIGAGIQIPTVRSKSERTLEEYPLNSRLIRINPEDCLVPEGQLALPLGGLASLVEIERLMIQYK